MRRYLQIIIFLLLCFLATPAAAAPELQLQLTVPQNSSQFIYYNMQPSAVAVGPPIIYRQQYIYVLDIFYNNIKKFDSNGNLLQQWGSYGTGNGQFQDARGIAVDGQGNVYVVDCWNWDGNHRIQKFDANGAYVTKWGSYGTGNGQFQHANGVAVDGQGNVYVADTYNNRIQKFDSNGSFLTKWGSSGTGDGQFNHPHNLATDRMGNVYVVDSYNNRIQKFDANGSYLTQWSYDNPSGVAVDNWGNVYVSNYSSKIRVFDGNGNLLREWGSHGDRNGQFGHLWGIAVDFMGNVYAADVDLNRIEKFDSSGSFLANWGMWGGENGQFRWPRGIAADDQGNFFVADGGHNCIQKFEVNGHWLANWGKDIPNFNPYGLALGGRLNLFAAVNEAGPYGKSYIQKLDQYGNLIASWGEGSIYLYGVALDHLGNLFVTDYNRIKKFDYAGNLIATFGTDIPDFSPTYLAVDRGGNLLVSDRKCLRKFDLTGHLVATWGLEIANFRPYGIALDGIGNVYVTDTGTWQIWPPANTSIRKFNPRGNLVATWTGYHPGNTRFYDPRGLAIKGNRMFVVDGGRVLVFGLPPNDRVMPPGVLQNLLLN